MLTIDYCCYCLNPLIYSLQSTTNLCVVAPTNQKKPFVFTVEFGMVDVYPFLTDLTNSKELLY